MSGKCLNNYWIGNGIVGNINKHKIIALDYGIFFHGIEVYVRGNHLVAFGGVDRRVLELDRKSVV